MSIFKLKVFMTSTLKNFSQKRDLRKFLTNFTNGDLRIRRRYLLQRFNGILDISCKLFIWWRRATPPAKQELPSFLFPRVLAYTCTSFKFKAWQIGFSIRLAIY